MNTPDKNGSLLSGCGEVFGVSVYLVETNEGLAITKRDAQRVLTAPTRLGIGPRQARAAISSYRVEGWVLPGAGRLTAPFATVTAFENRVLEPEISGATGARKTAGWAGWPGTRHGT